MQELSSKTHWDEIHSAESKAYAEIAISQHAGGRSTLHGRFSARLKRLLGPRLVKQFGSYEDYLLWEVYFRRYLPELKGLPVLEIGCAPGDFLLKFADRTGCIPYGVDYSAQGIELNKKVFDAHGYDSKNIIEDDCFAPGFQQQFAEFFDAVISRGFIEHFDNVDEVVNSHISLLKRGGYLIVNIPNVRGANYLLTRILNNKLLAIHNLTIMGLPEYRNLFNGKGLEQLYCGYFNAFSFYLFYTSRNSVWRAPLFICQKIQPFLDFFYRYVFADRGPQCKWFSSHLLFIGRKV